MNSSPVFERTAKMRDALSSAVFIDRDGTIMEDTDYCSDPKDVRIFPGVLEALRRLKSRGFKLIIITNQSGIGRGLFTLDQYRAVESEVLRQLGDGLVDATYYCPDAPGQHSKCRKPAPGMVVRSHARPSDRSFPFVFDWRQGGRRRMRPQCGCTCDSRADRNSTRRDRKQRRLGGR